MTCPRPSQFSRRSLRVWQRNFDVYKKNWKVSFIPPLFEPVFYILAFGVGLSVMVGDFEVQGRTIGYTNFIARR